MQILVANANTTQRVTDVVVAEARHHAAPGTEIVGATAALPLPKDVPPVGLVEASAGAFHAKPSGQP